MKIGTQALHDLRRRLRQLGPLNMELLLSLKADHFGFFYLHTAPRGWHQLEQRSRLKLLLGIGVDYLSFIALLLGLVQVVDFLVDGDFASFGPRNLSFDPRCA